MRTARAAGRYRVEYSSWRLCPLVGGCPGPSSRAAATARRLLVLRVLRTQKPLGRGLSRLRSTPRSRLCGLAPKRGAVWAARGRSVLSSSLAPGGSLLAVSDSLGRISLVDLVDLLVVRMFKGHCRPPARPRTALCAASPRLSEQRLRPIHRFASRTERLDERLDCTVYSIALCAIEYGNSQADSGTL